MKKANKFLLTLSIVPLLASCGPKTVTSISDVLKCVKGEDERAQKHDATKVYEAYSKAYVVTDANIQEVKSVRTDGSDNEKKIDETRYNMETYLYAALVTSKSFTKFAYGPMMALGRFETPLNAFTISPYVNAEYLLNEYVNYTEKDESTKGYPHSDDCLYTYKEQRLDLNFTLTETKDYENVDCAYMDKKELKEGKETLHVGIAVNIKVNYLANGAIRSMSFVASAAHKAQPGSTNDHFPEASYTISGEADITYIE